MDLQRKIAMTPIQILELISQYLWNRIYEIERTHPFEEWDELTHPYAVRVFEVDMIIYEMKGHKL